MPAGLVEHDDGVGVLGDGFGDLIEMKLHRRGIAKGQDQAAGLALGWADGAKDVGRAGALIARRDRPGAPFRPAPGDLVLLAYPGFVLPPEFEALAFRRFGADRCQRGGEVFLNAAIASGFCS